MSKVNEVLKERQNRRLSKSVVNVAIGLIYDEENVGGIGIYNMSKGALSIISPEKAKDMFNEKRLSICNVNLAYMGDKYFRKNVDFTIGKQEDYPTIREKEEKGKKTYQIDNGCIIYDTEKIQDKDGKTGYKCIYINNNTVKSQNLLEKQLVDLKKKGGFACNYGVKGNKVVLTIKENGEYFELTERDEIEKGKAMSVLSGWYTVDDNGLMEKIKECPYKEFVCPSGVKMIKGFEGNENIEKVDLTGAERVCQKAFYNCKNLKEVIMSDSMKSIDSMAFSGCSSLKELKVPHSVEHLGESVYMKGTAYIFKKIGISPFGKNVKVVMYGKADNGEIEIALFDVKDNVVGYKVNTGNINEKTAFRIPKNEIGITQEIYNFDMQKQKVLGNNTLKEQKTEVIIGKAGQNYATIDVKGGIKAQTFEILKKKKLSNGIVIGGEIVELENQPKWKQIEMSGENVGSVDKEGGKGQSGRMASYLAQSNDIFDALTNNQVNAISEYMSYKFYELLDGKTTFNCMSEEIKKQYPNLVWKLDREQVGGVKDSDNADWRKCYFGHATTYHWVVFGIDKESKQVEKVFTFGSDCVSNFLNIDKGTLESIMELEGEFTGEMNEMNKDMQDKAKLKARKEKYKICYEVIEHLRKKNKLALLGELERHVENFDSVGLPYIDMLVKDIARQLSHGKCGLDVGCVTTDYRCLPTLVELVKNKENLTILYSNKGIKTEEGKNVASKLRVTESFIINGIVGKRCDLENIKALNEFVDGVFKSVKKEDIEKSKEFIKEFNKLGLKEGKYVINEEYAVNTNMQEIYKYDSYNYWNTDKMLQYNINNQTLKEDETEWKAFMEAVKNGEYRPTKSYDDNTFSSYKFKFELSQVKQLRSFVEVMKPETVPAGKTRVLAYGNVNSDGKGEYYHSYGIISNGAMIMSNKQLTASSPKYTYMIKGEPNWLGDNGILSVDRTYIWNFDKSNDYVNIDIDGTTQLLHNDGTQIKGRVKRFLYLEDKEKDIDNDKFIKEEYARLREQKEKEAKKKQEEEWKKNDKGNREEIQKMLENKKKIVDKKLAGFKTFNTKGIEGILLYSGSNARHLYIDYANDRMLLMSGKIPMIYDYNKGKIIVDTEVQGKLNKYAVEDRNGIIESLKTFKVEGLFVYRKGDKLADLINNSKDIDSFVKNQYDLITEVRDNDNIDNSKIRDLVGYRAKDSGLEYVYMNGKDTYQLNGKGNVRHNFKEEVRLDFVDDAELGTYRISDIGEMKKLVEIAMRDDNMKRYNDENAGISYEDTEKVCNKKIADYEAKLKEEERIKEEEKKNNKLLGLTKIYHDNEFFNWVNANNKDNKTKIITKDGIITYAVNNKDMINLTNGTVVVHNKTNYVDIDKLNGIRITTLDEEIELITENGRVWVMPKAIEKKVLNDIKEKDKKEQEQNNDIMKKVDHIKAHLEDIESWTGVKAGLYKGIIATIEAQGKVSYKQAYHINNCYEDCIKKYPA